mmetsp:Transcript_16860/g.35629  ORF Transcript_16860/g.35629 Transcript_16860/m.35629 type:complete len:218 (+) Transcript_16860:98-751(+)
MFVKAKAQKPYAAFIVEAINTNQEEVLNQIEPPCVVMQCPSITLRRRTSRSKWTTCFRLCAQSAAALSLRDSSRSVAYGTPRGAADISSSSHAAASPTSKTRPTALFLGAHSVPSQLACTPQSSLPPPNPPSRRAAAAQSSRCACQTEMGAPAAPSSFRRRQRMRASAGWPLLRRCAAAFCTSRSHRTCAIGDNGLFGEQNTVTNRKNPTAQFSSFT